MNELEQECIILNSAWDTINGMVNWAMFWDSCGTPDIRTCRGCFSTTLVVGFA